MRPTCQSLNADHLQVLALEKLITLVEKYFGQVAKRNSFRQLTMLLGYTISTLSQQDKTNLLIFMDDQLQVLALDKLIKAL